MAHCPVKGSSRTRHSSKVAVANMASNSATAAVLLAMSEAWSWAFVVAFGGPEFAGLQAA